MKNTEKLKHTKKLSVKLMWTFVIVTIVVLAVFTVISEITKYLNEQIWAQSVYVAGIVMIALILALFVCITNKTIVRRIENINTATNEIAKGNYDLSVPVSDNDELTELSENFNKMTAELRANAFLSKEFSKYVSHEFKTPLAVIRSYAEALQLNGLSEQTDKSMEIIISEVDKLSLMTKTIIELCRLDSTTLIQKNDVFSPAKQVRSELIATQLKWEQKHIDVNAELEEFEVKSNESLVLHIWQNLISNAIKFTDENGKIFIELKKQNDTFVFIVKDDGIGIADCDKERVFDMFFTGDKSRNKEGSGLGLSLTKKIVEKLGGEISFISKQGEGTTFTVVLPA